MIKGTENLSADARPTTDLVVVGAGTAGLVSAITAAEHGRDVLLLEKGEHPGGTLPLTDGRFAAAGTLLQEMLGIDDHVERHLQDVLSIADGGGRPDLIAPVVRGAPEMADWLTREGFLFSVACPGTELAHEPYSVDRTYWGPSDGRSILRVLERKLAKLAAEGRIDLRVAVTVDRVNVQGSRVQGVSVRRRDASRSTLVEARAVVLATGGYSASAEWFSRLHGGRFFASAGALTSTGDGLTMVEELGGDIVSNASWSPTFGGLPAPDGSRRIRRTDRPILHTPDRRPWEIYVSRDGCRFVAEDEETISDKERALTRLPEMVFFQVFDAKALHQSAPIVAGWTQEDIIAQAGEFPGIEAAYSLEELANKAGIDAGGLVANIEAYNQAVTSGIDEAFGRQFLPETLSDPPFYSIQNYGAVVSTCAGVDVDEKLRVRRADGTVIDGLYAIGELLGTGSYMGNGRPGGMSLTTAMTQGRSLGRRLGEISSEPSR